MSNNGRPLLVLNASIAMKWYLNDEKHVDEALRLFRAYRDGQVLFVAPDHIRYEVANALRTAARTGRVSEEKARQALWGFLAWGIPTVGSDALLLTGYTYAERFGCALYDALYLALADQFGCQLIHADRRLKNTLANRFPRELWIEDFESL